MLLIFDLDGTLVDSSEDLARAMNATRTFAGMEPLDPALIYQYVGNGAEQLVRRALGASTDPALLREALVYFLDFYSKNALANTFVYPGMRDAIQSLTVGGHRLAVLTNKPTRVSIDLIHHLELSPYFARIYGGDSLPEKKPFPGGIDQLRDEFGTPQSETLMIGDSSVDVQTARNAGVKACGVAWGFQPGSFRQVPPDYTIDHPQELMSVVASIVTSAPSPNSRPSQK